MMAFGMKRVWRFLNVASLLLLLVDLDRSEPIPNVNLQNTVSMEYKNCLGLNKPLGYLQRNPINLLVNNWFGSAVNAHVAKIILEEVIGIQTSLLEIDNQINNWALLGTGDAHAVLEIWSADTKPIIQHYESEQAIISAGPLGIIGEIGWYVPRYVQDYASEVLFGTFSEQAADYFNHTFFLGNSAWTTEDQAIIDYNRWNLTITNLTGEYELLELLLDRYSKNEPLLFYFWKPHPIHQFLDLVKIQLEDAVLDGKRHTWYSPDILTKFIWAYLPSYSYEAAHFIKSFTYGGGDQTSIMSELILNGSSYTEAACHWIKKNKETWALWVPPVKYQEVPAGLQIAMYVLASFSVCVAGFYLVMTLLKYHTKVIVAASGMFLVLMCVGGFMIFGSVIAWALNTSEGCSAFIWLLSTGFALLFGSLFAKNARIYMLFSNRSLQVVKYSDRDIAIGVVCLVAGEWVLLIVGQILQSPTYAFINYGDVQYSFCIFYEPTSITLLVYNGLMIVVGIVITALVSKLKLTLYNESRYIALAVYNFAFAAIFFVIVFFVRDVIARFAVTCCAILFIGNTALGVIFIPKLILLFKYTPDQLQKMNDEQLNAMIRGFSNKLEVPNFGRTSTEESKPTFPITNSDARANDLVQVSAISSLEDELSKLSTNIQTIAAKNEELIKENTELKARIALLTSEDSN